MRLEWVLMVMLVGLSSAAALAGHHFRIKAPLRSGAPAQANYRHDDIISRGTYLAMLDREEAVDELNSVRKAQDRTLLASPSIKSNTFRKVFRAANQDVATTAAPRSVDVAPVRLSDIRLAAYSDGRILFSGRIQDLPRDEQAMAAIKDRTDGCRVTIRVSGFGATQAGALAVASDGPMLFECKQHFWKSKGEDCAISLVCPEGLRICGSAYQELTHLQVEVETRRNR